MVIIPIVFHTYGISVKSSDLDRLIDTLNVVFNAQSFPLEDVFTRKVNPNAVNFNIRFIKADQAPEGFNLEGPGLDIVVGPNEEVPPLRYEVFRKLEEENTWNTDLFINIWVTEFFTFDLTPSQADGFNFIRGFTNLPVILDEEIAGLQSITSQDTTNGPFNGSLTAITNGILLNGASVFGEHPDYIVSMMGHFLGLFGTNNFDCSRQGDYCADTPTPQILVSNGSVPEFESCTGHEFTPTNFMASGRRYRDLTFDQRERVRKVLQFGIGRPKI